MHAGGDERLKCQTCVNVWVTHASGFTLALGQTERECARSTAEQAAAERAAAEQAAAEQEPMEQAAGAGKCGAASLFLTSPFLGRPLSDGDGLLEFFRMVYRVIKLIFISGQGPE